MKRRTFIRNGGLAVASAFCLPGLTRAEKKGSQVAWVEGDSPYQITKKAVALLGGMAAFVSRQDVVMVKPNIAWNRTVEQAANTNPEVVRAVVEMALEAGAKRVIVMDNSTHRAVDAYNRSGIEETARRAGAEVRHVDENRLVSFDFKGESVKKMASLPGFPGSRQVHQRAHSQAPRLFPVDHRHEEPVRNYRRQSRPPAS